MADDIPSIVHHVSIGVRDHAAATAFYEKVLTTIGARKVLEFPGAVAFGKQFPEFWAQTPMNGQPATTVNGMHFAFIAPSKEAVHDFHAAAPAPASQAPARTTARNTTAASPTIWMGTSIEAAVVPET